MTRDDDADREEDAGDGPEPVPESDPQHIDPAGDLADAVESGELGPVDPGLEAQVRIARALLDDLDDGDDE